MMQLTKSGEQSKTVQSRTDNTSDSGCFGSSRNLHFLMHFQTSMFLYLKAFLIGVMIWVKPTRYCFIARFCDRGTVVVEE